METGTGQMDTNQSMMRLICILIINMQMYEGFGYKVINYDLEDGSADKGM